MKSETNEDDKLMSTTERLSISTFLDELDAKIKKARTTARDDPRIGVFWLHLKEGKVRVFHSIPVILDFGHEYGDYIIAYHGHYDVWESLKRLGVVPKNKPYVTLPRGRVAFDKVKNKYVVFIGKWVTTRGV